jgi:hypothetical protein
MDDFFQTATPYLLLALAGIGWLYRREYERRVAVEHQVSERKFKAYSALIDLIFDTWKASKGGKSSHPAQLETRMMDALKDLMLYASDDVLILVQTWLDEARGGTVKLGRFGEIVVAIRRDMGNPKTKVTDEDVLRQLVKDYDVAKARGLLESRYPRPNGNER